MKEIKLELIRVGVLHKETKNELSKLVNKIEVQSQNEADWEKLKLHFDFVYSGFFDNLNQEFPHHSQLELRHCGFMKLQLDTKEIAQILRISPKSVQASRYRIKKKLNLPEKQDLRTFINQH